MKNIDLIVEQYLKESNTNVKNFEVPKSFRYEDTSVQQGDYRFVKEFAGKDMFSNGRESISFGERELKELIKSKKIVI